MDEEKYVDESWKEEVARDKEISKSQFKGPVPEVNPSQPEEAPLEDQELDFLAYISSLAFQAMIFLGKLPNPGTNQTEKNLRQAKLMIDTLSLLREKTKGNLSQEESDMLNAALYELQMGYAQVFSGSTD